MKPELHFEEKEVRAAELGQEAAVPDLSGEKILQNNLIFDLDADDEIYQGYGRVKNAFPYRQRNGYNRKLSLKKIKTAVLENDFLKAVFLPGYGGRLWELWDKSAGRNLLYTNDVLRFSNLAVRNAWFSGGVEWNIGIIGHTPFTTEQLYVARTEDGGGNPVLRMYEYERIRKVVYQMDFWLEEDSRFLNCRMRIVNEQDQVIPMYWWSNIAVPEYENGHIIVPAEKAYTFADGTVSRVDVPMVNGIDIFDYKKIPKSVDYFFDIEERSPKYIANVDAKGYGLLHVSTARLRSRKLFSWGNRISSDHWQAFLTDEAGRYIEMQGGLAKTQYGCLPMEPGAVWEWLEQFGPAGEIRTMETERGKRREAVLSSWLEPEYLEKKLKDTEALALQKAELLEAGSGYGVLGCRKEKTAHLAFKDTSGEYEKWKAFLEGDRLVVLQPEERPDVFLYEATVFSRLLEAVQAEERENWYAHYQLGVCFYARDEYGKAREAFLRSLELAENAWALHGLAVIAQLEGENEKAVHDILRGMELQKGELSYVKEGIRLLSLCGGYREICSFYESMPVPAQQNSRLRFYYIQALHRLGEHRRAYDLMEENGGLILDDIREGEDSLSELWKELRLKLYGETGEVPYRYCFKAY